MKFKLKNRLILKNLFFVNIIILILITVLFKLGVSGYNSLDWKILDFFYKDIIVKNHKINIDKRIKIITITKDTYEFLGSNYLDRKFLGEVNNALSKLSPQAIIYDLIFSFPGVAEKDSFFSTSIKNAEVVFLPVGLELKSSDDISRFVWPKNSFTELVMEKFGQQPFQSDEGNPPEAKWALTQLDDFTKNIYGLGNINSFVDPDGIFRRLPLFIKADSILIPTLSFSVLLDYYNIPFSAIKIYWGEKVVVPPIKSGFLSKELDIPIDNKGFTYVAFPESWNNSFEMVQSQNLVSMINVNDYYDELTDMFEGNFVFIGDVSPGISDLGSTPIEKNIPLILMHASLLNDLLNNSFFTQWNNNSILKTILLIAVILGIIPVFKNNLWFYLTAFIEFTLIIAFSIYQVHNFVFIPVATISISFLIIFLMLLISIQIFSAKQESFIKNAFSHYVQPQIVENVLDNPQLLKLGGETKFITILFSDIADFTSISEKNDPAQLVRFLNKYFTEMTKIVLKNKGTIDKYIGDGLLAEFGAPVELKGHASLAVKTSIEMIKICSKINSDNELIEDEIKIRVGINSGDVIVGNMGSLQVFDYTCVGDNVNLAARLESANKVYNTNIMITESCYNEINKKEFIVRPLDFLRVKGKTKAVKVFEVMGFTEDEYPKKLFEFLENYHDGFYHFERKNFGRALYYFDKAYKIIPDDIPTLLLRKKINNLIEDNEFDLTKTLINK